jgi:hypothetical protein
MKGLPLLRFGIALCALALTACSTRAPELKPQGTLPITLSVEKKSTAATAQLFNLITITLPAPKAPGYHWQISFHDTRYLKQTTEILPAAADSAGPTVSFIAKAPGRTRVRFMLVPASSARVADPVDQQELVLTIE